MKTKLEFQWRNGDLALVACPKHLVRFEDDEENVTINFLRYYRNESGKELCFSIGFFKYNERESCWSLYFVGDRFKEIAPEESAELWKQLGLAYDTLSEWIKGRANDDY